MKGQPLVPPPVNQSLYFNTSANSRRQPEVLKKSHASEPAQNMTFRSKKSNESSDAGTVGIWKRQSEFHTESQPSKTEENQRPPSEVRLIQGKQSLVGNIISSQPAIVWHCLSIYIIGYFLIALILKQSFVSREEMMLILSLLCCIVAYFCGSFDHSDGIFAMVYPRTWLGTWHWAQMVLSITCILEWLQRSLGPQSLVPLRFIVFAIPPVIVLCGEHEESTPTGSFFETDYFQDGIFSSAFFAHSVL